METIYILIPVAILLIIVIISVFVWAARSGQFEDLEGPAHRILMDNEEIPKNEQFPQQKPGNSKDP